MVELNPENKNDDQDALLTTSKVQFSNKVINIIADFSGASVVKHLASSNSHYNKAIHEFYRMSYESESQAIVGGKVNHMIEYAKKWTLKNLSLPIANLKCES